MAEVTRAKHTPEPWNFTPPDGVERGMVGSSTHPWICELDDFDTAESEANAQRIVACVNACTGIADPVAALEAVKEAIRTVMTWTETPGEDNWGAGYDAAWEDVQDELRPLLALLTPPEV